MSGLTPSTESKPEPPGAGSFLAKEAEDATQELDNATSAIKTLVAERRDRERTVQAQEVLDKVQRIVNASRSERQIADFRLFHARKELELSEKMNQKLVEQRAEMGTLIIEQTKAIEHVRGQMQRANTIIESLPTKKAHHECKQEIEKLKKEVKALQSQKQNVDLDAMPNKKKLLEKIRLLESDLKEARQLNKTTLSHMEDTKAQASMVKKQLSGSEQCHENKVRHLREELKEQATENDKLRRDLGSMELLAGRLREENTTLQRHNKVLNNEASLAEDLAEKLADAQNFIALARYPLENYAKIRRRMFNGRRGDHWINEERNRKAHDGDLISDLSMYKLGQISPTDITKMSRAYGDDFTNNIKSSEDVHRLHGRGFQLELINLRASMKSEDPQTCLESMMNDFHKLDEECKKIWESLLEEDLSDEKRCEKFDSRQDVQERIIDMREIRKRAAGRSGGRVAYEERTMSPINILDSGDTAQDRGSMTGHPK